MKYLTRNLVNSQLEKKILKICANNVVTENDIVSLDFYMGLTKFFLEEGDDILFVCF